MFIIDNSFHQQIASAYHQYLIDPIKVDYTPDEYVERLDYISCSSLGKCPKAYAAGKRSITPKFPELIVDNDLPALMRMRAGTEAGITFACAMRAKFGEQAYPEKYLHDDYLKVHGFADVVLTDDIGQTAVIEVKKRAGYFKTPSTPRITDCYQLLMYGLILSNAGITARLYLVLVDGGDTYPLHVYELVQVSGGYELRDQFNVLVNDFTGEVIQPYSVWEHPNNSPLHLNHYELTAKINVMHTWLSMDEVDLMAATPIPNPWDSKMGFQCIKWEGGTRPKALKTRDVVTTVCASCPFSCHFNSSVEKKTVIITSDGRAEILAVDNN